MRTRLAPLILFAGLLGWAAALFVTGKDAPGSAAPAAAPKPKFTVDPTPVAANPMPQVASYADMVEQVQPAVVSVYSTKIVTSRATDPWARLFGAPSRPREEKEEGLGSGVIVSPDGYIITNNHVVEGADELSVLLPDDREFRATLIGADPKTDVAVIKIEAEGLTTVTLADSDKLRVGDVVFAFGNPLGVGQTVTMGIVSAKGRNSLGLLENVAGYEDFIQTDAAINMGNSGGALVDAKGRLVGINSAIVSTTKGNIGIGFAIPINLAASIMHSLVETGTVARGYLGASAETATPEVLEALILPSTMRGVVITNVNEGGPAATAGLKPADVIFAVDGKAVTTLEDLRLLIAQTAPGSKVQIDYARDGEKRAVAVELGQFTEQPNELVEGVEVEPVSAEVRRRLGLDPRVTGLVITRIADNSPYAGYLIPDVVIVEINRSVASDLAGARGLLRDGRNLLLVYYRGQYRYLTLNQD
ncbi:MAG: Do family serine endopeptidase [Cephaloticoccus sp.]